MKTFRKLWMALVAILACMCYSCGSESEIPTTPTPDEPEKPQEQKMVTVKLNVESIVSVQEMPMGSRAGETTNNDLYLIEIYNQSQGYSYAYGLFDLTKNITIELPEGELFTFRGVAVKDGKNKIYCNESGIYAAPFAGKFTNSFTKDFTGYQYRHTTFVLNIPNGNQPYTEVVIAKDLEVYELNSNFSNSSSPYTASDDNTEPIEFCADRISYIGTEFTAIDMKEGKLVVNFSTTKGSQTYYSPEVEITKENEAVFNTFSFNETLIDDLYGYNNDKGIEIQLNVKWVNGDTEVDLTNGNAKINVKNGYKYAITIDANSTSTAKMNVTPLETPTFSDYNTENWFVSEGDAYKN